MPPAGRLGVVDAVSAAAASTEAISGGYAPSATGSYARSARSARLARRRTGDLVGVNGWWPATLRFGKKMVLSLSACSPVSGCFGLAGNRRAAARAAMSRVCRA